jgi:hypothetical protein
LLGHPKPTRYVGQSIFVVRREAYVYLVPFVEDEHTVFLRTIIGGDPQTGARSYCLQRRGTPSAQPGFSMSVCE